MIQQNEFIIITNEYENGVSLGALAKKYQVGVPKIKEVLLKQKIGLRTKGEAISKSKNLFVKNYQEEDIIKLYTINNYSLNHISKIFGMGPSRVKSILKNNRISIRSVGEQSKYSSVNNFRQYSLNHSYFQNQSPEMAYFLGFIAADGSIHKYSNTLEIGLSVKDGYLLEEFIKILQYTGKVKYTINNKGFEIAKLNITSQQMKIDLSFYNIIPQKTNTFVFPEKLSPEYYQDFIRGYFDGDGSIGTSFSICSVRKEVLERIVEILKQNCYINNPQWYTDSRREKLLYDFRYCKKEDIDKIYKYLYYKDNLLCLKRKKEKFLEIIE